MKASHLPTIVLGVSLYLLGGCGPSGKPDDEQETVTPPPNQPPEVVISQPEASAVIAKGETVLLAAEVSDAETAPESLSVTWRSDVEGTLGEVNPDSSGYVALEARFTISGEQQLTVVVADEAGLEAESSVTVTVNTAPTAKILGADTKEPYEGLPITFTGKVSDLEDDERNLDVKWTDDQDTVLGSNPADSQGNVSLTTDELASGTRTVTLEVRDSSGTSVSDSYRVTVQKCLDQDGDGYKVCIDDCDDQLATVYPGAVEACDGLDNDCNGIVDNGWPDVDHDGTPDCRDVEECDGMDNNGDGQIDEGFDQDSDGVTVCGGDCDDGNPDVFPGAVELCDGVDNNCNFTIDEGLGDDYEPNDSLSTATELGDQNGVDEPVSFTLQGTIHTPGDSDWYAIELEDDFALGLDEFYLLVRLSDMPEGVNYDLYLWWVNPEITDNPEPYAVQESTNTGNADEELIFYGIGGLNSGGNFWIQVQPVEGYDCVQTYTLYFENMG